MSITIRTVKELGQGEVIWDTSVKGFGARRQLNSVSYVLKYRHNGKQRFVTLGRHGVLTPDEARREARKVLGSLARGIDPVGPKADSLAAVINDYLAYAQKTLRPNSYRDIQRYLLENWKAYHRTPVANLKRRDVALGLADIEAKHSPIIAHQARAALSAMFNWAIRQGYEIAANPVLGTNQIEVKSRDRVLTKAELAAIWRQCKDDDYGRIVRLLILMGQRRDEVGRMQWSELDLDRKVWVIPGDRTKNHKEHILPLTDAAIALLPERWRDYVFGPKTGFANWGNSRAKLNGVDDFRLHDLRRTCATGMAELGVLPHIIEAILNHVSGHKAGVAGIYNKARYLEEMRAALTKWSQHIEQIVA
jgi:integrase